MSMGPVKLEETMRELLARGADRAVLISDPAFAGSDTVATAKTISLACNTLGNFDLILCGRRAIDGETGQIPGMLASALNIPCYSNAEKLESIGTLLRIHRILEGGTQSITVPFPLCVSLCEYTYTLRLPGIMGMRRAKKKTVEILNRDTLSIAPCHCGLKGSLTKVIAMDTKFPGLRKGPKNADIDGGIRDILSMVREVSV